LKATFNPIKPSEYNVKLPIYLDDQFDKPYMHLEMAGVGAVAKLLFDRK